MKYDVLVDGERLFAASSKRIDKTNDTVRASEINDTKEKSFSRFLKESERE